MALFAARALAGERAAWPQLGGTASAQSFTAFCRAQGIDALLFRTLAASPDWATWPEVVREALESAGRQSLALEMLREHHLRVALGRLEENGIRLVLMKGAALAATCYRSPGTRTRADSDIFIHPHDITKVRDVLVGAGYEIVSPTYKTHQFTARLPGSNGTKAELDIHWRIQNNPRFATSLSFDEVYHEAEFLGGAGGVKVPSRRHALLLACMHRVGSEWHDRDRLIWLYDIHLLFSSLGQDGQLVYCRWASDRGLAWCSRDGLLRANALFGTAVPGGAWDILADDGTANGMLRRWAGSYLRLLLRDLKDLAGWRDRARLLGELLAPRGNVLMRKFGKRHRRWLLWLYLRQITTGLVQRLTLR